MAGHKNSPLGCGYTTKGQEAFDLHENKAIIAQLFWKCKGVMAGGR